MLLRDESESKRIFEPEPSFNFSGMVTCIAIVFKQKHRIITTGFKLKVLENLLV
jgi:hypothetical protein